MNNLAINPTNKTVTQKNEDKTIFTLVSDQKAYPRLHGALNQTDNEVELALQE